MEDDKPVFVATDFGVVDVDKVVQCIYSSCDPDSTNSIPVTLLITFLKPYFLDNLSEFVKLCNLLDPDGKNHCVSQKFFSEALSQWTSQITNTTEESSSSPDVESASSNTNFTEENFTHSTSALKTTNGYYQLLKNCSQILKMSDSFGANSASTGDKTVDGKTSLELEEKIKQLQHDVHKATSELEVVRQQLSAAEEQNESLLADLKRITKSLIAEQKLNEKFEQCRGENDEIKEEYSLAKKKILHLQMSLDNAIKDRQKLLNECSELENKKLALENKIESLQKKELEARTLTAELKVAVGEKDAEITSLVKLTQELKVELEQKTELITFLKNEKELVKVENDNYEASLCQDLSDRADSVLTELKLFEQDKGDKGNSKNDDSKEIPEQPISPRLQMQRVNAVSPNLSGLSDAGDFTNKLKAHPKTPLRKKRNMSLLKYVLLKNASTPKAYDQDNIDFLDQSTTFPIMDNPVQMSCTQERNEVASRYNTSKVDIKPVQNERYVCSGRTYQGDEGEVLYNRDFKINLNLRSPHKSLREELWVKMGIEMVEENVQEEEIDLEEKIRFLKLELKEKDTITTALFKNVIKLSQEIEYAQKSYILNLREKDTIIQDLQGECEETRKILQEKLLEIEDQNRISDKMEKEVSALKQELDEEKTFNKMMKDKIQLEADRCCKLIKSYETLQEQMEKERLSNAELNRKLETEIRRSEDKLANFESKLRCVCEKTAKCLDFFTLHKPTFGGTSKNLTELDKTISLIVDKFQACYCDGNKPDVEVNTSKINNYEKNQLKMEKLNCRLEELKKDFSRECSNSKQLREEVKIAQEQLEQERNTWMNKVRSLSESLSISKATSASLQKENQNLIEDNFQINFNFNKAQDDVELKMSIIRNFEENVTNLMLRSQHLERKLQEEKATVANLKRQNGEMSANVTAMQQLNATKAARIGILEQQLETNNRYLEEVRCFVEDQCSLLISSTSEIISVYALEDDVHFEQVKTCSNNVPIELQSGILKFTNQIKLVLVLLDVIIRRSMKREPKHSFKCPLQNSFSTDPLEFSVPSDYLDFSRSLQEFDKIEEHLNEMANQSALPNQTDSFLDSLGHSPRSLSKREMKEKFTALALAFNIDISTVRRRYEKQEKLYNQQVMSHTKCIDCIVNVLNTCSKMQNPQIDFALIGLERLRKFTEIIFSTAEHFGVIKYESRSIKCWNLAINYVAILDQENCKRILKLRDDATEVVYSTGITGNSRKRFFVRKIMWGALVPLTVLAILAVPVFLYVQWKCLQIREHVACPLDMFMDYVVSKTFAVEFPLD